jgi:Ca2+-transporting ATPase
MSKSVSTNAPQGNYFEMGKKEVTACLNPNSDKGLNNEQVEVLRSVHGKNEFTPQEQESFWDKLKASLTEPMIVILLVAAAISALIGESHDAFGILGAIAVGIGIGLFTEGKSKKAADALSKLTADIEVKALRNGQVVKVSKSELVPGDIVYLETGDMVPADGRLIETVDLRVKEDMLTGESDDVKKDADAIIEMVEIEKEGQTILQNPIPANQINMVFGGTLVAYGRGTMIVTSIGDKTEMGEIAQNLSEEEQTPLQIKLGTLGTTIAKFSSAIAGLLFIYMTTRLVMSGVLNIDTTGILPFLDSVGPIKTAFTVCVALIVAAVPEGLPTMINMTLAITMQKMSKINALVTKKEACETIGSVSVICSDKTGTLTENRMTVEKTNIYSKFFNENCMLNSTADINYDENHKPVYMGSATECALLLHISNNGLDYRATRKAIPVIAQEQFSSATKQMSTTVEINGTRVKLIKGAPEVILERATHISTSSTSDSLRLLTNIKREDILKSIGEYQEQSMRVLGFAYEEVLTNPGAIVFIGFVGIKDPLRDGVDEAVKNLKLAGVSTKMLTGDNIITAKAIGEELGLLDNGMRAVESSYIDTLTDEQLQLEIQTIGIVARSKPDTKMRVVQALQNNGEVVAVTGDGINDAPALAKADVGIAMGISGTEVSKGAADIILTDDSFNTIEKAVKWGRGIYDNFQRFVQFQLTVNIVAFLVAIVCTILDQPMPFTTVQLLWVNIIMDGPPALALGLEPVRDAVLRRKPTSKKAHIITKAMGINIVLNALFITGVIVAQSSFNFLGAASTEMGTVSFALFAFFALFNALNAREFGKDSIIPNFLKNKLVLQVLAITGFVQVILTNALQDFFSSVALGPVMWIKVLLTAFSIVVVNEIIKFVIRKVKK